MPKGKELSNTEIQEIIDCVKGGMAISTVASIAGIGVQRIEKWIDEPIKRRGYMYFESEKKKDVEARNTLVIARAYWDKFDVGNEVEVLVKIQKKGYVLRTGPILEKKKEYIVILHNDRRMNIAFTDVLAKQVKIRHKNMNIGENKEVLSIH